MAQSRQTPRVWSDAIRGSEILANWLKLGTSAVFFWLSIGIALGVAIGGFWFLEGTTSLDRRLWVHHVRSSIGIGGRISDLPNPDGSGARIQVRKDHVQHYTWRSYETVSQRLQESVFLGFLLAIAGTVTSAYFLRESGRTATEDQHIRGATLAPPDAVIALAQASKLPYDFTLAGVPIFRDAETDHVLVCGVPGSGKGIPETSEERSLDSLLGSVPCDRGSRTTTCAFQLVTSLLDVMIAPRAASRSCLARANAPVERAAPQRE